MFQNHLFIGSHKPPRSFHGSGKIVLNSTISPKLSHKKPKNLQNTKYTMCVTMAIIFAHHLSVEHFYFEKNWRHICTKKKKVPFVSFSKKNVTSNLSSKKKFVWFFLGCHKVSQSICGCVGDGRRQLRPSFEENMTRGFKEGFWGCKKPSEILKEIFL